MPGPTETLDRLLRANPELKGKAGTYVLVFHFNETRTIQVGRLGCFSFDPGWVCYVGSAFGPGGLLARLNHHLGAQERPRWHVDYLKQKAQITEIRVSTSRRRLECVWARALFRQKTARMCAPGFGASDCPCPAHLIHFTDYSGFQDFSMARKKDGILDLGGGFLGQANNL